MGFLPLVFYNSSEHNDAAANRVIVSSLGFGKDIWTLTPSRITRIVRVNTHDNTRQYRQSLLAKIRHVL